MCQIRSFYVEINKKNDRCYLKIIKIELTFLERKKSTERVNQSTWRLRSDERGTLIINVLFHNEIK